MKRILGILVLISLLALVFASAFTVLFQEGELTMPETIVLGLVASGIGVALRWVVTKVLPLMKVSWVPGRTFMTLLVAVISICFGIWRLQPTLPVWSDSPLEYLGALFSQGEAILAWATIAYNVLQVKLLSERVVPTS